MYAEERLEKIRTLLLDYKRVDTNTLISMLPSSAATVRRDLERLEKEGFLQRTRGGAILAERDDGQSFSYDVPNLSEKKIIGTLAAEMIQDNDVVFIGYGTTCQQVVRNLDGKQGIKVITNDVNSLSELIPMENCKVMVPGGELERRENNSGLFGRHAIRNISNLYFQKCFISVEGADLKAGYMVNNEDEAELCRILMEHSEETVLLLDHTKFGQRSLVPVCPLNGIKKVISSIYMPDEYKTYYYDHGVNIFIAIDEL